MSKTRNNLFLMLASLFKYSIILFCLIPSAKNETDTEISFILNCNNCNDKDHWAKIFGDTFNYTSKATVNGNKGEISLNYCFLDNSGINNVVVTFNKEIDSYANMFKGVTVLSEITLVNFKTKKPKSMANMFYGSNFQKITFQDIDTSEVKNMSNLFANCQNLKQVDVSPFNTASVTDMSNLFSNCINLGQIDLSNFDTSSVTNMSSLFYNCENLEQIDISSFDTSSVEDMDHLFEFCRKLKEIDLSNFNTASVKTMNSTFRYCEVLEVIDARSFDTSKVTNMYDLFGYCYQLVYINVSSFSTVSVKIMQGIFINCHKLKYLDISNFNYTTFINACQDDYKDSKRDHCKFHYTFAYCENLICLNFKTFYINDRLLDNTFNNKNSGIKFCVDENNIKVELQIKNSCNDQCFKDMAKKFDISNNEYVDSCDTQKFDFNDLCWTDCPYNYYRLYTDRRTCSKASPGENFFLDTNNNLYTQCYKSCKTCTASGTDSNHNCDTCAENYKFISSSEDKYAVANNCYQICATGTYYYFKSNHEYFCVGTCPKGFKFISEKNKCIDSCTNDNKYKNEYDNTCVEQCPEGTANINNKCESCYESCGSCDAVGSDADHKCDKCKSGYSKLNKDNNCYKNCDHYYYFDDNGKYVCLEKDECPENYKLINEKNKCIKYCKDDKIFNYNFEYNGVCFESCSEGSYTKEDGTQVCKCMTNTTCKDCNLTAIEKNLCSSCNTDKNYYPIKEEKTKDFMNCYDSTTIPSNYILNLTKKQYEPCYDSCSSCNVIGDKKDHKCNECISGYTKLNNDNNCYEDCAHYYYFDGGEYICREQDECPEDYKLINGKNKCIKFCKDDKIFNYNFEYNGGCYSNCPNGNYTKDVDTKVCKCMTNTTCKDCTSLAIEKKLCSSCNTENGYYPMKDESNKDFMNCYNSGTIPSNYILISGQYEPCYDSCGSCTEKGSDTDHKCTECKSGYSKLIKDKNNCYENCEHYYYFDDDGNYVCLNVNKCPSEYKLINSTNKCIKNCKDDNIFNSVYEYNGGCYKNCPNDYYTKDVDTNVCKCMTNIACKDCPSENNVNNLCSTCNIDKSYYPKELEKNNNLKNCYNGTTIPTNYIFNSEELQYKACYDSCQTCTEIGTEANHKCKSCKTGYQNIDGDTNNCRQLCDDFFYYDDNSNLQCTSGRQCPENYKLIDSSTKCIKNCNEENLYEYNNVCYAICPYGYYNKNGVDTCKCMTNISCKECPLSDTESDLCYNCNNEAGYYPIKDESNPELKICYNSDTILKNYFLNKENLQYEPCYKSCGSCTEEGSDTDHNCKECKSGYSKLIKDKNNCYEDCEHYYYFDDDGKYVCLNENKCPSEYKLINSTNKCIKNCKDDNIFNSVYEYNGGCYKNCPNDYYTKDVDTNVCKCMTNIACKDCPSENNVNNLCSTCNIDKFYYPKNEESSENLKNCYNKTTIPSNYILSSGQYMKCYKSCQTCSEIGTDDDHKCKDCLDGYIKLNNDNNCYEKCQHYYYFNDEGDYVCLEENKCPNNYKLLDGTNKCIKNCLEVDRYEYNNVCYSQCPQYWTDTDENHICKLDCKRFNMFFNYEKTDCISSIPKGYYLENIENKILGKCHENCEECESGPTETNNNCKTCQKTKTIYYDLGNCRESCVNGNYIDEHSVKKCKCSSNIECKECDENGKCLSCNNDLGYYKLEEDTNDNSGFIKCVKEPEGYYLSNGVYKKCNERCKSCSGGGDEKCIECKSQYEFRNDFQNDKKCYEKCEYNYYYDSNNNNVCTEDDSCPSGMKFIESKKRCIDLCKNDNLFKFEFGGKCFAQCPDKTHISSEDNHICEEKIENTIENEEEEDECNLKLNELDLLNNTLTSDDLNNFTTIYASKYGSSDNYIIKLENEYFKIFIYKNAICLQNVSQDAKAIDFGENFLSLLGGLQLNNPIITIITNKTSNTSTYSFAHPDTGETLSNLNEGLRNAEIKVQEDIYSLLSNLDDKRREYIMQMLDQEIDVFDPSNDFYTNLCFYYDSPNNKDIPMCDRASFFFANISKCEVGCTYQGIDFSLHKFKCECKFKSFSDDNPEDGANPAAQSKNEFPKKKSSSNIEVFKCLKDVFKSKYLKKCTGGIIMLILSAVQIGCMALYFVIDIQKIKKHVFSLFKTFKSFSSTNMKNVSNPPKKPINNKKNMKENPSSKINLKKDLILINSINNKSTKKANTNKNEDNKPTLNVKELNEKEEIELNKATTEEKFEKLDEPVESDTIDKIGSIENEEMYTKFIKELINPEFNENDFDDVITKDKRTFLQFFTEKIFKNQMFIKTFYIKHIFQPLPLKIMLLVLTIELYFVITAFFYTEGYLSDRFYSDEKEGFLSFISKRFYEIVFTMIICGIIGYFCSYIFDNDDYLRRIFTNKIKINLDSALSEFIKNLKIKFIILIVISIIITIFSFLYISCFNVVYPYIKSEWLKSSILIFILMQIINLLSTLLGTCCRYLSIKWNNVKLFRLSLNLD